MDLTADVFATSMVLHKLVVAPDRNDYPRLPPELQNTTGKWDVERIAGVLATARAPEADHRFPNADRMLDELESCREFSVDSLFADIEPIARRPQRAPNPYLPIILAAIIALPWLALAVVALALIWRFL